MGVNKRRLGKNYALPFLYFMQLLQERKSIAGNTTCSYLMQTGWTALLWHTVKPKCVLVVLRVQGDSRDHLAQWTETNIFKNKTE